MNKVSLIIPTFNRAALLQRGLYTVLTQSVLPAEIIIVDDGGDDDTARVVEMMANRFRLDGAQLQYWRIERGANAPARLSTWARNFGIRRARGDVIFFTEPEVLHVGNTLAALDALLLPGMFVMASRVWSGGRLFFERLLNEDYQDPRRIFNHPYAHWSDNGFENPKQPNADEGLTGCRRAGGWLFGARLADLVSVGAYDEALPGAWGFEDYDLFHRLETYGLEWGWAEVDVIHPWHDRQHAGDIIAEMEKNKALSEARTARGAYVANEKIMWGQG